MIFPSLRGPATRPSGLRLLWRWQHGKLIAAEGRPEPRSRLNAVEPVTPSSAPTGYEPGWCPPRYPVARARRAR